jgi:hypothetical protein
MKYTIKVKSKKKINKKSQVGIPHHKKYTVIFQHT